jgi:hypothetical protein
VLSPFLVYDGSSVALGNVEVDVDVGSDIVAMPPRHQGPGVTATSPGVWPDSARQVLGGYGSAVSSSPSRRTSPCGPRAGWRECHRRLTTRGAPRGEGPLRL